MNNTILILYVSGKTMWGTNLHDIFPFSASAETFAVVPGHAPDSDEASTPDTSLESGELRTSTVEKRFEHFEL